MKEKNKFEIVEFYPFPTNCKIPKSRGQLIGTLHIYICDFEMDLKGINVILTNKGILYFPPGTKVFDEEQNRMVYYPFINFTNESYREELLKFLKSEGTAYIWKKHKKMIEGKRNEDRNNSLQASA